MIPLALQNPSSYVGEPDMAPATNAPGTGTLVLGAIALYAVAFWLVFKGPLRHWAQDNPGGAWALLALAPGVVGFLILDLLR